MTDNAGGFPLGSAQGDISISTSGIVNARKVVERESVGMTRALDSAGQKIDNLGRRLDDTAKKAAKLRISGEGLSAAGGLLNRLNIPGGEGLQSAGQAINAVRGLKQLDQALEPLVLKVAESGGLIGGLVDKFGGLISVTTGLGTGLSGVLAIALPVVGILGAVAVGLKLFNDKLEASKQGLQAAVAGLKTYYDAIQQGTTESINKQIAALKAKNEAEQAELKTLQDARRPSLEAALKDPLGAEGIAFLTGQFKGMDDRIAELQKSTAKTSNEIDGLNRALGSTQVAANNAAEAQKATEAQDRAFIAHKERNAEIDAQANEQILEEENDFHEKREQFEKEYVKKITKFDADESKRHSRAVSDADKQIQAVRDNAATREVQAAEEIDKIKTTAQKDELRALADHQREMADMEREHKENLLEAASRLDARAVFEELKNFGIRKGQTEDNFKAQRDKDREATQDHIRSITERVAADNAADAARIEKLRATFAEEEAVRQDEARAHREELIQQGREESAQLDRQHADRLAKIASQHTRELNQENNRFIAEFNALGAHNGRMINLYKQGLADAEREIQAWVLREQGRATAAAVQQGYAGPIVTTGPVATTPSINPNVPTVTPLPRSVGVARRGGVSQYAEGTSWSRDGGMTHEGEVVANRSVSNLMREVLGSNFSQQDLASAFRGGNRGGINVTASIYQQPGMSNQELAHMAGVMVEEKIIAIMEGD
jgi:polyhydroxyalkanoate synthesis regulator phasin